MLNRTRKLPHFLRRNFTPMRLISPLAVVLAVATLLNGCNNKQTNGTKAQKKESAVPSTLPAETLRKTILFLGNSLTAGYGLSAEEAFPALLQQKIDSLGLPYTCINAGLSGETSAGGRRRIGWLLRSKPDIVVLELGANDGLRGISLVDTRVNLQAILDTVKTVNPEVKILIAGMQLPPNLGPDYTREFRTLFVELAKRNNASLIPFLLDGVAGISKLNQPDGIHPTAEGQGILAKNVWQALRPLLKAPA